MSAALHPFFERLKQSLKEHPSPSIEQGALQLRQAAVLAPLYWLNEEPFALATMRPKTLRKHPGQISFPGGGSEPGDLTPLHTALRETQEELGIAPEQVEVLGMLGGMPTVTSYYVQPFVGVVPAEVALTPSQAEIDVVLRVPLFRLREEKREFYQAMRDAYVWEDGAYAIWGATWRMLRQLMEHVERVRVGWPSSEGATGTARPG